MPNTTDCNRIYAKLVACCAAHDICLDLAARRNAIHRLAEGLGASLPFVWWCSLQKQCIPTSANTDYGLGIWLSRQLSRAQSQSRKSFQMEFIPQRVYFFLLFPDLQSPANSSELWQLLSPGGIDQRQDLDFVSGCASRIQTVL